jgi:hypothetical protein
MTARLSPSTCHTALVATAVWLVLVTLAPPSLAQQRLPVADVRTLLLAAHDAPDGVAAGVLAGPSAEAISQRFSTTAPIMVDVHTLHSLAQPGCRRLGVRISQAGVQLPGAASPRLQVIEFGVDHCHDGLPPRRPSPVAPAAASAKRGLP